MNNHRPEDEEFICKWIQGPDVPYLPSNTHKNQEKYVLTTSTTNNLDNDATTNAKSALSNKLQRKSMEDEFNAHIEIGTWE